MKEMSFALGVEGMEARESNNKYFGLLLNLARDARFRVRGARIVISGIRGRLKEQHLFPWKHGFSTEYSLFDERRNFPWDEVTRGDPQEFLFWGKSPMSELTDDYFGEPWEPCSGEDPCTKKTGCTYAAGHSVPHSNDSDLNSPPAGTLPLPATKGPPEGNGPQSAGIVAGDELSDPPPAAPPAARDDAQSSPPVGPASPKANVAQPKVAAEHSGHQTDETSSDSAKEPNRHAVKTDVKESEYDAAVRKAHEEGKWAGWDEIEREFNKAFGKALAHEIEKGDGSLHRARVTRSYKSIKKYAKDIGVVIAEGDSAALPTTMNKSDIPKVVDEALRLLKRLPR